MFVGDLAQMLLDGADLATLPGTREALAAALNLSLIHICAGGGQAARCFGAKAAPRAAHRRAVYAAAGLGRRGRLSLETV